MKKFGFSRKIIVFGAALLVLTGFYSVGHMIGRAVYAVSMEQKKTGKLAIVIDDFGYDGEGTEAMLALSVPLTAAVLPFSEHTGTDAELAYKAGKEIIIHMPMEPLQGKASWVGEKGIFRSLTDEEIKDRVRQAIDAVPHAVGLNNHMGSAIMEDRRCLSAILDVVKENNLIFIDSVTTAKSLAQELCAEKGIPYLKRNVFLDSTDDVQVVKKQLRQAGEVALKEGSAVAIGHVGPEGGKVTVDAIRELAGELEKKGVEFIPVSALVKGE